MRRLATLLLVLLATACGGGRDSPERTFESLLAALAAGDGARVHELHDADYQAWLVRRVRDVRGRLGEGESAAGVLEGPHETAATFSDGSLEEATGRVALAHSMIGRQREWFDSASVVDVVLDGEQQATIQLRGVDGAERQLYFVKEPAGWSYDQYRHYHEALSRQ